MAAMLLALHLNALRLGGLADDERCGGVGSEDICTRRLVTSCVVTVTGVVPGTNVTICCLWKEVGLKQSSAGVWVSIREALTSRNSASVQWSVWSPGC